MLLYVDVNGNNISDISPIVSAKNAGAFSDPQQNYVEGSSNYLDLFTG